MKSGNAFARGVVNGWQISGITQVETGIQINNGVGGSSGNAANNFSINPGGTNIDITHLYGVGNTGSQADLTLFPLLTCNPTSGLKTHQYLNPSCFAVPTQGVLGNAGMPYMPGPMFWNTDLSLLKNFKIKESQNLQFRFAAFNPLNHGLRSFTGGDPNLKLTYDGNGNLTNSKFGQADYTVGGRVIELGIKYSF